VATDKRKQSLYFPEDTLSEIQAEAIRQDRSLSWIVQRSWSLARGELARLPSPNALLGLEPVRPAEPVAVVEEPAAVVLEPETCESENVLRPEPAKKCELPDPYLQVLRELKKK
jgi:uncharacterized small protein (TIGR04563 family)